MILLTAKPAFFSLFPVVNLKRICFILHKHRITGCQQALTRTETPAPTDLLL